MAWNRCRFVDREVGALLKRLEMKVLPTTPSSSSSAITAAATSAAKQFLYDDGTRIPMIMRWPGKV